MGGFIVFFCFVCFSTGLAVVSYGAVVLAFAVIRSARDLYDDWKFDRACRKRRQELADKVGI
jgi:hypothetical protein